MSSSTSCSYPPTSIGVTPLILDLAWVMVVAINPCPASKGVHPIAELNVVLMANWKEGRYNVLKFLYSWSDNLRIMAPMVWFTLSQMAFPLGLCPPVVICSMFKNWQMISTAPRINSGALSVRNDKGTPLLRMTCFKSTDATCNCDLEGTCSMMTSLVNRSTITNSSPFRMP